MRYDYIVTNHNDDDATTLVGHYWTRECGKEAREQQRIEYISRHEEYHLAALYPNNLPKGEVLQRTREQSSRL